METNYLHIFLVAACSYLVGCIPSAFLVVKRKTGLDISKEGSGNLGAMNSYEVTKSKSAGILVLAIDVLKGIVPVVLSYFIFRSNQLTALSGISVIFGHNFNAFLKFKGGRGLATAAGTSLAINPLILILWGLCWLGGYKLIMKQVHVANAVATVFNPLLIYYTPELLTKKLNTFSDFGKSELIFYSAFICLLILVRHFKPLVELWKEHKNKQTANK